MPRDWKPGFTLVEMLVVLAIIGAILALGIPAVTNLMKSGGLGAATREVSNSLTLARQYAITQRATVRVVFPYSQTTASGTNQAPIYQSYAVLEWSPITNYLSKWEFLPLGSVFMDDNSPGLTNSFALDNLGTPANMPFPYTNSLPPFPNLAYIEFSPTGAATQSGTLTITEGIVNAGKVIPTSKNPVSLVNYANISVDSIIGHIKVTRP